MLFSVIIPTYHRNDLLARCLDRLAPGVQTMNADAYEVIVSDDGALTTAEELVRTSYPWAQWIEGPRRGPAANRNSAVQHAHGEMIVFTDDDCIPDLGWLDAYVAAHRPDVPLYEGKTDWPEPYNRLIEEAPLNRTGGCLWSCNMMIESRLFSQMGGFDETFPTAANEDSDFRERLRAAGFTSTFVEQAMVLHPPRPRHFGSKAGRHAEADVIMWYKAGNRDRVGRRLVSFIIRERLHTIRTLKDVKYTPYAVNSMVQETLYIIRYVRRWDEKYRIQYEGVIPAYCAYKLPLERRKGN